MNKCFLFSGPTGSGYIIIPQNPTPITHSVSNTNTFTDMMAELPMSIANINTMNELLKLQMSEGVDGMDLDSALFDNFFTPEKDQSSILKQNQKDIKSTLNEDLDDIFTQGQIFKPAKPKRLVDPNKGGK